MIRYLSILKSRFRENSVLEQISPILVSIAILLIGVYVTVIPSGPVYAQSTAVPGEQNTVDFLKDLLKGSQSQDTFLPADEAYRLKVDPVGPARLQAVFTIADGYYLYRDKTKVSTKTPEVEISELLLPDGKLKSDAYFGEQVVYYNQLIAEIPLVGDQERLPTEISVTVDYQGCAEQGICYPPTSETFLVTLPGISEANAADTIDRKDNSLDADVGLDQEHGYLWPILLAFLAGLALTFTPCVLPLIPILTSIVVGGQEAPTRMRAGVLSISYVFGTAATYTAVGVFAGATGSQLQAYFQNPWGIGVVVFILVALSLSLFGFFNIQVPPVIQARLQKRLSALRGGAVGGVFMMGVISALIVGACVSPVLMAVLGLAIERADPVLGGVIMFSLAMGSGVVLIGIGFGAAFLLPKAGPWMKHINHAFGIMLLGVAIYILGALPAVPVLYLWSVLLVVTAIYLGALRTTSNNQDGWQILSKGLGVFVLVWGVLALLGAMSGSRDILRPVNFANFGQSAHNGLMTNSVQELSHSLFTRVASVSELDLELGLASDSGKLVMLDYYADWCVDCIRMENTTFADSNVRQALKNYIMLQVDVTDPNNAPTNKIKKRYGVYGPPAMLFFDSAGNELKGLRRYGYMDASEFVEHIKNI